MIKQAFILCAGKGTRLHPDTIDKPKCLLPVSGKSVLCRIVDWLEITGIQDVIINTHWQHELLENHPLPIKVTYSFEKELLGTAGGISKCYDSLQEHFVVVYGDVLTNLNLDRLIRFHFENNNDLTIASHHVKNPHECGVIISDKGRVTSLIEKPNPDNIPSDLVNAGILVCRKEIFSLSIFDISHDLIPNLVNHNARVYHMPLSPDEWLIDMGTRANYDLCCKKYDNV